MTKNRIYNIYTGNGKSCMIWFFNNEFDSSKKKTMFWVSMYIIMLAVSIFFVSSIGIYAVSEENPSSSMFVCTVEFWIRVIQTDLTW
jgi:hypothetical protein